MALFLSACTGGASGVESKCTYDGEMCVNLELQDPVVYGEPITATITISANSEIKYLFISLTFDPRNKITILDASEPESAEVVTNNGLEGVFWRVDLSEGQTITLTRSFLLPPDERIYSVIAAAHGPKTQAISDVITFSQHDQTIQVYLPGTPYPTSPSSVHVGTTDPIIQLTIDAMPSSTPRVSITPKPTAVIQSSGTPYPPPPYP